MTDKIKVIITTYQVPYDSIVESVTEFEFSDDARKFINAASSAWWMKHHGNKSAVQFNHGDYEPIDELGYDIAFYELWDGENTFHAMLDQASFWRLHNEYYQREFDDKGLKRPGYLRVAQGEDVSAEVAELQKFYQPKH